MTATPPRLVMRRIEKRFAGVAALSAGSLEIMPAEVMGLVGQNGAGKSTMIKILTGYYERDAGEVAFEGRPFRATAPQDAQRQGISTIYQEINLVPLRTVTENICLGRERRRFGLLDWRAMHEEARRLLARFRVDIDVRRPLGSYSTAVQQMVAIARAVSFDARLVIMDEPTSSLDERECEVLFAVIRQLKAEGVSVLFVSHYLDELYAVCDRVTVMRDGRTITAAPVRDLGKLELVAAMLGRDLGSVRREGATAFRDRRRGAGEALLSLEGLKAGRRLRDVSLAVRKGEIVGLAGLLGSGRTETARAVFGADPVEAGRMRLDGSEGLPASPAAAIAGGVGYCSEDRKSEGIIPDMSVRENLTLALLPALSRAGVVDAGRQRAVVDRFIERLGVRCSGPEQRIGELSGGNQQKVLLARWLCMNPKLLILDEPTRGIDVGAKAEIQALILELAEAGLGVLMISSELEEIVEGADRVFVLREGRTVAELPHGAADEPAIMAAMAHG